MAQAADPIRAPAPVRAAPTAAYSGEGELLAGFASYSASEADSVSIIGGATRATIWFAPNMSAQLDGNFESWNYTPCCGSWNIASLVGHANMRNQEYLLGFFGGLFDADWDNRFTAFGAEGQLYLGNTTLEGRAGFFSGGNPGYSFTQFRGAARFFLNPDLMAELNAGFQNDSGSFSAFSLGGVLEHKLAMAPVSIFGSLDYGSASDDWSVTTAKAGLKFLYNQPTLRSADKTGSSLGRGFDFQFRLLD